MANYYGSGRTNYFRVKDRMALVKPRRISSSREKQPTACLDW
jgi:hypothetical protein